MKVILEVLVIGKSKLIVVKVIMVVIISHIFMENAKASQAPRMHGRSFEAAISPHIRQLWSRESAGVRWCSLGANVRSSGEGEELSGIVG